MNVCLCACVYTHIVQESSLYDKAIIRRSRAPTFVASFTPTAQSAGSRFMEARQVYGPHYRSSVVIGSQIGLEIVSHSRGRVMRLNSSRWPYRMGCQMAIRGNWSAAAAAATIRLISMGQKAGAQAHWTCESRPRRCSSC